MKIILYLLICSILMVALVSSSLINIVTNGDFESGNLDPWVCHGCNGEIVNPGHDSDFAFKVEKRQQDWAGPLQILDLKRLSNDGRYNLGYSIIAESPVEIQWMIKVGLLEEKVLCIIFYHYEQVLIRKFTPIRLSILADYEF